MKRLLTIGLFVVVLGLILAMPGCASYYKVKDPQTGNMYYTEKVDYISGGAVRMIDARTGSIVTIQNSEVKEISSDEYKKGLAEPAIMPSPKAAPVAASPAAAPAMAPAPAQAPAESPKSAPSGTQRM